MAKISGASALMRFARTTPQWQSATRRVWNPASISWKSAAQTLGDSFLMSAADVNVVFPNVASGIEYTISFWVKPRTITGAKGLMQLENAAGVPQVSLTMNGSGIDMMWDNDPATVVSSTGLISLNTWNHILFQNYDNGWNVMVNGTDQSGLLAGGCPDFSLITQWRVGRGTLGTLATEKFDGLMSDIMVAKAYPNYTNRLNLYNGGAAFNMAQTVLAPNNPLNASMTFLCDGTDTGTPKHLGVSRLTSTNISPQIQKQASFAWTGSLANTPDLDSASRPAASGTTYTRLAELAQGWDNNLARTTSQGTTIKPMPTGKSISRDAPALLAWPFSGYGVKTSSASFVGLVDAPQATPHLTVSGVLTEQGTASNPVVGAGTLQHALDARVVQFLRPTFAKKV
jgi:hypothetical protein